MKPSTRAQVACLGTIATGAGAALVLIVLILRHPAWPLLAEYSSPWLADRLHPAHTEQLAGIVLWLRQNLGSSVAPFALIGLCYAISLGRGIRNLAHGRSDEAAYSVGTLQLWAGCFFGIGVLWTTIGIRDALLHSLGDLSSSTAASVSAYELMQRLVEGGVLTALTTTVIGGAGAYLMSILTHVAVLAPVQKHGEREDARHRAEVLSLLAQTRTALLARQGPTGDRSP